MGAIHRAGDSVHYHPRLGGDLTDVGWGRADNGAALLGWGGRMALSRGCSVLEALPLVWSCCSDKQRKSVHMLEIDARQGGPGVYLPFFVRCFRSLPINVQSLIPWPDIMDGFFCLSCLGCGVHGPELGVRFPFRSGAALAARCRLTTSRKKLIGCRS